MLAIEKHKHST